MTPLFATDALGIRTTAGQTLVEPLSIALFPGRALTVIGETGSGKSLFAQGIVDNLPPGLRAYGRLTFADGFAEDAGEHGRRAYWGREIAVLPQEPWLSLDPTMRAQAQVAETYRALKGLAPRDARERARQDMVRLGLTGAERKFPCELSGGMAQRLAFAATHAGGARVMVADEPTKGLDRARIDEIVALLRRGLDEGCGLLIITHDLDVARRLGGDVMIMLKGKVVEQGTAEAVLERPQHAYTQRLLDADPARWPRHSRPAAGGEAVAGVSDLAAVRGGRTLFEGLSFALQPGEIVGVTGPSGCGKSTLGDILLGLAEAHAGSVLRRDGGRRVAFQKLYQDPVAAFPPSLTLGRNLADLVRLHRLDGGRIAGLMQRLRLGPALLERRPGNVSGGELQRFSLLRVLLLEPLFIFADEPSSRLDPITQREMLELLLETAEASGTAVLLVSHDEALIEATCDRHIRLGQCTPADAQEHARAVALSGG